MKVLLTVAKARIVLVFLLLISSISGYASVTLQGLSVYSDLNQQYFVAAIHTEEFSGDSGYFNEFTKRKIEIRIISEIIRPRRFARIWINGFVVNNKSEFYESTDDIIEFGRCIKNRLRRGDILSLEYDPAIGTSMSINGSFIHTFAEPKFFNLLLNVLVGDIPLSTNMKKELMAEDRGLESEQTKSLYESLSPTKERIAEMPTWLGQVDPATPSFQTSLDHPQKPTMESAEATRETRLKTTPPPKSIARQMQPPRNPLAKPEDIKANHSRKHLKVASISNSKSLLGNTKNTFNEDSELDDPNDDIFFTLESLLAERDFNENVSEWVSSNSAFPVVVSDRPDEDSIKFTITVDKNGKLLNYRQFEKSKYAALNKGALKLIKKSIPYPKFPQNVKGSTVDLDLYFRLHWRYRQ